MVEVVRNNSLPSGFKVHWYEIESILGDGGFGITYLAHDRNLDQKVAVKEFFPRELASRSTEGTVHTGKTGSNELYEWGLSRFLIEARTLAKFKHPNIVFVYSVFEENQTAYMVMEHLSGGSLRRAFKQERFDTEEKLLRILFPLLDGIRIIHDAGFIHRDIKPSNILFRETGEPVLLDFGSARQALGIKTRMLTSLVSPGFTPFEQYADGSGETEKQGPWTDLYSLAATLYMAIFDKCPVDALKRASAILASTNDPYLPAAKAGQGKYSPRFLNAIDSALSFYPAGRPQNVEAFIDLLPFPSFKELNRKIAQKPKKTPVPEGEIPQQPEIRQLPEPAPRNRWLAGLAALIVITVAAYYFINDASTIPTESPDADRAENLEIHQLLGEAKQDLFASRLIAPPHNNAIERFNAVLQIDKENTEAMEGIESVIDQYARLAKKALSNRQLDAADAYLDKSDTVLKTEAGSLFSSKKTLVAETRNAVAKQRQSILERSKKRTADLLAAANRDMAEFRLSAPKGNNAMERFQSVLEFEPENQDAIEGLRKIVERYLYRADKEIAKRNFERAGQNLEKAAAVIPALRGRPRIHETLNKARAGIVERLADEKKRAKIQEAIAKGKQKSIERLLEIAGEDLKAARLASPSEGNAYDRYKEVLDLDPDNQEAMQGLKKIVNQHMELTANAASREQFEEAKSFLAATARIQSEAPKLDDAQSRLDATPEGDKGAKAEDFRPALSESDVLGNWCSDAFKLKLERTQWTFRLANGNTTTYPVQRYAFTDDSVLVYWSEQDKASMITELGNFATGPDKVPNMTQIRGKADGTKVWHAYNRLFKRCQH